MPSGSRQRIELDALRSFAEEVFRAYGVPARDAETAADVLVAADRRGVDSHGVARLETYVSLLEAGQINPKPDIEIVRETVATATVDGDDGLGLVVGPYANRIAMEKAEDAGTGWVAVRGSNHFGIAGYYPLAAIERNLVGWAVTNTSRIVTPLWGAERMLGTNPLATAFPGKEEPSVVIDMATSIVAYGKLEMAHRRGEPVPEGWGIDARGRPTTDPEAIMEDGAQLPLGGDRAHGGHKGYCLSALVDLMSCLFSGAAWGPFAPAFAAGDNVPEEEGREGEGLGHLFGAWSIGAFTEPERFRERVDRWVRRFRETRPAPGTDGPLIPGDPEREAAKRRKNEGVPLLPAVVEDLRAIADRAGVPFPESG